MENGTWPEPLPEPELEGIATIAKGITYESPKDKKWWQFWR